MGTFVTGNTALPVDRTNAPGLGIATQTYELDAAFLNAVKNAAVDLRTHTKGWITLEEYGAVGDGATDDTLAIRAAVAAAQPGQTILGDPSKTYLITLQNDGKCVEITKAVDLNFQGAQITFRPWSLTDPAGTHSPALYIHGSTATGHSITAATDRETTLTFTSTADSINYSQGDWILVTTTATKQAWDYPDNTGGNTYGNAAEPQQVASVDTVAGTVTLTRRLDNFYPANATVAKFTLLQFPKVRNISKAVEVDANVLSSKPLSDNVGHLVSINQTFGALVENVECENWRMFVVFASQNVAAHVENVHGKKTDGGKYTTTGGHAYVIRHQVSLRPRTYGCTSYQARHLLDYTMAYDAYSEGNTGHLDQQSFLSHGFGSRRVHSKSDAAHGSGVGWGYGNSSFGPDYEAIVEDFCYVGPGSGIGVSTLCEDVDIINPNVVITGSANVRPVGVTGGAKRVRIKGGCIDTEACTSANTPSISAGANTSGFLGIGLSSASATPGTDAVVTVNTSSNHGFAVGQSIYISLYDIANGEYEGVWTVSTTPSTTQFTFVRFGTTTQTLSITSSPSRSVWPAGNYKPISDLSIEGVRFKANAVQSQVIIAGCKGNLVVEGCIATVQNSTGIFLFFNDSDSDTNPVNVHVTDNIVTGAIGTFFQLERPPSSTLLVERNVCTGYTATFANLNIPSYVVATTWHSGVRIVDNMGNAPTPTTGLCNQNLWTLCKNGGSVGGNAYPANAAVTNAANRNWEWGTFSPTLEGATTAGTASYSNQTAHYQLADRVLHVRLRLNYGSFTGTGQMRIKGMPFSNSGVVAPAAVAAVSGLTYSGEFTPCWTADYIVLQQNNAGALQDVPVDAAADLTVAAALLLTGS